MDVALAGLDVEIAEITGPIFSVASSPDSTRRHRGSQQCKQPREGKIDLNTTFPIQWRQNPWSQAGLITIDNA